ncbi:helix-turn-helix domain-containing protein [Escherichia coli]|nr:helix-turn-helix domain-containing protein [Escherichia coli]
MGDLNHTKKHLPPDLCCVWGQTALSQALNSKRENVWFWLNKSGRVPAEFVLPIEQATQGQVTRSQLRPDIYPECPSELKASNQ